MPADSTSVAPPVIVAPRWALWSATWFGCGYAKKAPGTVGSLGALPLFALLSQTNWIIHAIAVLVVVGIGVAAAQTISNAAGATDPQFVVIDEVAGVLIALGLVYGTTNRSSTDALVYVGHLTVAWVLFRALDIMKPWPISMAERARPAGVGIMLDDIVAGLCAGIATALIF